MSTALVALLFAVAPARADDAPEYLLGTLSVRLDLDKSRWHMTRWSDWDFEAKVASDPILLQAWATSVRAPVDPPEAWGKVFSAKAEELKGTNVKVKASSVEAVGDRKFAFVDVTFELKGAGLLIFRGAATEINGKNFVFGILAPVRLTTVSGRDRADVARRLVFTATLAPAEYGGTVKTDRYQTKLPDGWRAIADNEIDAVTPGLLKLGLEDLTGCWTAVRPIVGGTPDVMASCSRPIHFGVVDPYSASAADSVARAKLFGAKVPEPQVAAMPDRSGLVYTPRDGLAFGVAPDSDQAMVVWALGDGPLGAPVQASLGGTTFGSPHSVTAGDRLEYWLYSRTFSPAVLCPIGCVCAGGGLVVAMIAGVVMLGGRRRRSDEDDE